MSLRHITLPIGLILAALTACSDDDITTTPPDARVDVDAAAPPNDVATVPPDAPLPPPDAPLLPPDVPLLPPDVPPPPDVAPPDDASAPRGGRCHFSFDCERDLAGPVCYITAGEIEGRCVECIPGTLCDDGVTTCSRAARCATTCASDDDCADAAGGPRCDTATGACVRCLTRDDCSPSYYCDAAANRCEYGCGADADCAGRSLFGTPTTRCDVARHTCEQCLSDDQCGAGSVCSARRCVPGCSAASPCPSGRTCCAGACVDTASSLAHCGACGRACPVPMGAPATCAAGVCGVGACSPGRADCDRDATNGCEANTATGVTSCGACGTVCPTRANASTTCAAGACGYTCTAGFADCDANPANGCEVDLRTTMSNCGRCGNACAAGLTCVSSTCSLVCPSPQVGCGMTCVDTQTDTAHCGGCGRACLRGQSCVAGACTGTPLCDAPLTGCGLACVDTRTSLSHCGACGTVCPTRANATATCASGACGFTCAANFADCDADPSNGCEVDLRTAAAHCGACGRSCAVPHGTGACAASACGVTSCDAGYTLTGGACVRTNPCTEGNGGCDVNATCTPGAPGARTCACNSGYVGTGLACMAESTCAPACSASQTCVNRVCVGNGPLRISLTWDVAGDMDLHVVPAGGAEIYYSRRASNGGTLDRDDTTGTGPENVYWSAAPPAGTYLVCVVPYRIPSATSYTVTVNRPGVPAIRYTGTRAASTGNAACSATSPYLVGTFTL